MLKGLFQKNREIVRIPQWPTTWRMLSLNSDQKKEAFIVAAFTMIGRVLGADGKVVRSESDTLKQFIEQSLGLKGHDEMMALNVSMKAGRSPVDFAKYARRFVDLYGSNPKVLRAMVESLLYFAWCDSEMGEEEAELIECAREIFGISVEEYHEIDEYRIAAQEKHLELERAKDSIVDESHKKLRRKFKELTTSSVDRSYLLLGCEPNASTEEIRKRYRELVFKCHPDRIAAKERNKKLVADARESFQKILRAYETIRKERGF